MKYLVSVFVAGKCVHTYYSDDLDELVTVVALYPHCDLSICDMGVLRTLTPDEIYCEVQQSRRRCREAMERRAETSSPPPEPEDSPGPKRRMKNWKRPVLCVETGQVFGSVRECSDHTGLPYMTITNCIKNGNATRGLHFAIMKKKEEDGRDI